MYPEKKKSYFGRLGDWFSGGSSIIPANEQMHQKCLITYLDGLRNDLTRGIPANCTVDCVVAFAMQVVTSLSVQRIAHGDRPAVWNDEKLGIVSTSRCALQY